MVVQPDQSVSGALDRRRDARQLDERGERVGRPEDHPAMLAPRRRT
jgi:hypothetical protein